MELLIWQMISTRRILKEDSSEPLTNKWRKTEKIVIIVTDACIDFFEYNEI